MIVVSPFVVITDGYVVYMGRDKFENELLIENGWPEDYWFHVDNLSSAHVYIRLNRVSAIGFAASAVT